MHVYVYWNSTKFNHLPKPFYDSMFQNLPTCQHQGSSAPYTQAREHNETQDTSLSLGTLPCSWCPMPVCPQQNIHTNAYSEKAQKNLDRDKAGAFWLYSLES